MVLLLLLLSVLTVVLLFLSEYAPTSSSSNFVTAIGTTTPAFQRTRYHHYPYRRRRNRRVCDHSCVSASNIIRIEWHDKFRGLLPHQLHGCFSDDNNIDNIDNSDDYGTRTTCADAKEKIVVPSWTVAEFPSKLSKSEAKKLVTTQLIKDADYGSRISLGGQIQQQQRTNSDPTTSSAAFNANDPQLSETYGEFPLDSLDILLDRALEVLEKKKTSHLKVVDLGSGCGRPALYMALSRPNWDVHGIEISEPFHTIACNAMQTAWNDSSTVADISRSTAETEASSRLTFHNGPAVQYQTNVLADADIVFCYSTAFTGTHFNEQVGAMILEQSWSDVLSSSKDDVVVITTDKALDPTHGWSIQSRIDVPNREVFESTGYIQSRIQL